VIQAIQPLAVALTVINKLALAELLHNFMIQMQSGALVDNLIIPMQSVIIQLF
jgi:hypothetical protein